MTVPEDIRTLADILDRANRLIADINHQPLSKTTAAGISGLTRSLTAGAWWLDQAAGETAQDLQVRSDRNHALRRLTDGLARMDPDKRREHAIDDQLDALGEVEAS